MNKQEAVLERIQKDKEDRQWNKYHETKGNGFVSANELI